MVIVFLFVSVILFVLADLAVRTACQRLREKRVRREREAALAVSLQLDFTREAKTLRRAEVSEPAARILCVDDETVILDSFRKILVLDGYCVDIYEFPNQRGKLPTTNISWSRAKKACERVNKRMCSEAEWERACKGPSGTRFPYGNNFDKSYCNVSDGASESRTVGPTGVYGRCRSGFGVVDLAGNVAEWTASSWGKGVPDKVVKGGAADQAHYMSRCAARANESSGGRQSNIGFRCCADLKQ